VRVEVQGTVEGPRADSSGKRVSSLTEILCIVNFSQSRVHLYKFSLVACSNLL
jgi:hypothetical protein